MLSWCASPAPGRVPASTGPVVLPALGAVQVHWQVRGGYEDVQHGDDQPGFEWFGSADGNGAAGYAHDGGSASIAEQQNYAERLIAVDEQLRCHVEKVRRAVIEGETLARGPLTLPGLTVEPHRES